MQCLSDIQIQAIADGEGSVAERAHAATCSACAARLGTRQQRMTGVEESLNAPVPMPDALARRVEGALRRGGATRLREHSRRRGWVYGGLGVAAATLLAVLFVVPAVRQHDATVSAAEILAKSASQLAATPASGVERLVYELVVDGAPRDVMIDQDNGTYRVLQAIDHSVPGRFRLSSYNASGTLLSSLLQDPRTGRRVMAMRVDNQPFRFETALPSDVSPSVPDIEAIHMQAVVAMMQASGNQHMQMVSEADGPAYRIDVPSVSASTPAAVWDLSEAHLIVDATDFHIVELSVKGAFLKQPYSLSYKLLTRNLIGADRVPPELFEVPVQPGEITLQGGEGSAVPAADAFRMALAGLAKTKQAR